ncbi:MAG: M48 family metalloprotease [Bdellovibrionaceae bacterium]|nr:M48 family metalloprotease [Pseudobdellovibrionaceae bacterium]
MREQDLRHMVYSIMNHPLFKDEFYKTNGERLMPIVEIPQSYEINAYAGVEEHTKVDEVTKRVVKVSELKIIVTPFLIRLLDIEELKAVLGHELCHLKYKDYNRLGESKTLQSIILYLVIAGSALVLPWYALLGMFIVGSLLIKRNYYSLMQELEKRADLYGGAVSSPDALASALSKLQGVYEKLNRQDGGTKSFMEHFQVHPSTLKRIEHLRDEEAQACSSN